ncbi:MAG: hypothetical protein A3I05_06515 [Deltaproteobacteria bacterium RIFCSPLOWO2_02_FULL_44_10]|nr:MAG: hypothetical protein A3C46_06720 [Deltaproteobacteria bacterium RIFCSPHIGHO2_02_FULL_44_16]OGQ46689.1 MAG: hypothetical protein A3I05_06515 [Deltaproteobacteria bacterium RIFCSPLOWO2_02_FULL_44_10]
MLPFALLEHQKSKEHAMCFILRFQIKINKIKYLYMCFLLPRIDPKGLFSPKKVGEKFFILRKRRKRLLELRSVFFLAIRNFRERI